MKASRPAAISASGCRPWPGAMRLAATAAVREKVLRLNRLYAATISGEFYRKKPFSNLHLRQAGHRVARIPTAWPHDPQALSILERTTDTALPHFPARAVEHDQRWRMDKDPDDASWTWDESDTLPENMFLASERGAGPRYYALGRRYLDDETLVRSTVAE